MPLPRTHLAAAAVFTAASIAAADRGRYDWQRWVKPLIVPSLQAGAGRGRRDPVLLAATAAATLGDWFMLRHSEAGLRGEDALERRELRRGAASFAVQQVGYSLLFSRRGTPGRLRSFAPVLAGLLAVSAADTSSTGKPDPVLVGYGLTLAAMVGQAIDHGGRARTGGVLFLASDSAIILGHLLPQGSIPRRLGNAFVMATYGAAQALLIGELSA